MTDGKILIILTILLLVVEVASLVVAVLKKAE